MIESKYTADLFDRHSSMIKKLSDEMISKNYSFYYKDLSTLAKLITLLHTKIKEGKVQVVGVIVGAVMKSTGGSADAAKVRELVLKTLGS